MVVLVAAETVVLVLLTVIVAGLLRSHGVILRALHELGVNLDPGSGDPHDGHGHDGHSRQPAVPVRAPRRAGAPAVAGETPHGDAVAVATAVGGGRTLLAFLSGTCLTCRTFWERFGTPGGLELPADTRLVVVTKSPSEEDRTLVGRLAPPDVTVVMSTDAWLDYGVPVAPYFALVDSDQGRVVGEGAAATWERVRSLMGQALDDGGARRPARWPSDATRAARADEELLAAGIAPGDPRLHPRPRTHPPLGS